MTDEAHATLRLPRLHGDTDGARRARGQERFGIFQGANGKTRLVLDVASGDYRPAAEIALPAMTYVDTVGAELYAQGRYAEGMRVFLAAEGEEATARPQG